MAAIPNIARPAEPPYSVSRSRSSWICRTRAGSRPTTRGARISSRMTVTLELKPEIEHRIMEGAAAQGVSVEAYLTSLIEGGALWLDPGVTTPEQFEADMDLLAEGSERLPVLSPDALSRENIYAD